LTGDESATRVAAKFMSAIAAVQILTRQRVQVFNERSSDKFSSGNRCRQHEEAIKLAPSGRPRVTHSDQCLEDGITLTQVLSPAASNSAKRSASFCVRNTPPISPSLSLATQYPRPFSLTSKWCKVSTAAGAKLDISGLPICCSHRSLERLIRSADHH
jgi:hypothetical protein